MGTIKYTKSSFQPPGKIDRVTYQAIKNEIARNRNFIFNPNAETFTQRFKGTLITLCICAGLFMLGLILIGGNTGDEPSIWNPIMGISMVILIGSLIRLLLEGPSYATFIKEKQEYFTRLTYAIRNSDSYEEFTDSFYMTIKW